MKIAIFVLFLSSLAGSSEVLKVKGEVFRVKDGKREMLSEGAQVETNEMVCTGENSYAFLLLFDGSELEIKQSTCITLEETEERPSIFLFLGRIINRASKILGGVEKYEVHTMTAVAGVRGTAFSATASEDGGGVFEVDEGEIEIESDEGTSYSVKEGESVEISEEGGISRRKPFHSEEEWMEYLKKRRISDKKLMEFLRKLQNKRETIKEKLNEGLENLKRYIDDFEKISKEGGDLEKISFLIEMERRRVRRNFAIMNINFNTSSRIRERLSNRGIKVPEEIPFKVLEEAREKFRRIREDKIEVLRKARGIVKLSIAKKIWNSLPDEVKERIRKNYRRWKEIPPEKRALIIENWKRLRNMPPEKRREIIKNYKRFRKLPEPERRRIIEGYERWKNLPPEKKRKIIENYKKFNNLPPEKRKEILKKFKRREGRW